MRRGKSRGSWEPLLRASDYLKACSASFPRAQKPCSLSPPQCLSGLLKGSRCSGSWLSPSRGRRQVPVFRWHGPFVAIWPWFWGRFMSISSHGARNALFLDLAELLLTGHSGRCYGTNPKNRSQETLDHLSHQPLRSVKTFPLVASSHS